MAILALATSTLSAAVSNQGAVPNLPDYTKAPYRQVYLSQEGRSLLDAKQEGLITTYGDTAEFDKERSNAICVFTDGNGKHFYADWFSFSEKVIRGYRWEKDRWVFTQQKTFQQIADESQKQSPPQ
jgi:hypothetical protein